MECEEGEDVADVRLSDEWPLIDPISNFIDLGDIFQVGEIKGRIGFCMMPGRNKKKKKHFWKRELEKDVICLKNNSIDCLITMISEAEEIACSGGNVLCLENACFDHAIQWKRVPIKDKFIPFGKHSRKDFIDGISLVRSALLDHGKNVMCHCNGGKGRSALFCASVVVSLGVSPSLAGDIVRGHRDGVLRNPIQRVFLHSLAHTLHALGSQTE